MNHTTKCRMLIMLLFVALSNVAFGQNRLPGIAAETNINAESYPRILPDLRVMFGVKAPDAQRVQLDLGKKYDMQKDADGFWTCTTDPQVPGFHYYFLIVDGVSVSDPASESFYGCGKMSSAIDVPEAGCDFYALRDVPHGVIRSTNYYSNETDSWRPINIYTPPGYGKESGRKYPVLYIQHGGGEDHRGWAVQGKTATILDNLIADGKAEKMIVVIANGNVSRGGGGYNKKGMEPFIHEMTKNIIPYVEANYRVLTDQKNRAIAGLSMGGGQAFYAGLQNTDLFGSVGIFSSGIFGGIARQDTPAFDAEKEIPGLLTNSKRFNEQLQLLYISVGEQDMRIDATRKQIGLFKEYGLNVTFETFPGDHEWQVWRKSLHSMASKLFK
ncbi:enterochelin esterase-like enzyme [Parabacteroides sp. PFB2-12]|uniref:alpha/beta hydrolase-fold protein n=1 Tax=unclassified Parabacteroides TaxID=2649774 RepID=UPI002475611A|nr:MULTISPECIES: alpha/beta hydrolase-fold protein [unclassified Parabacteroides]MDH6343116.1 enterochelin esterase-like enzyme [Parabacteroides sp. PM6-13]MDH6390760.1 enterochelin esterase-like enzyme [Parabacteroides sp. PFB2-12]